MLTLTSRMFILKALFIPACWLIMCCFIFYFFKFLNSLMRQMFSPILHIKRLNHRKCDWQFSLLLLLPNHPRLNDKEKNILLCMYGAKVSFVFHGVWSPQLERFSDGVAGIQGRFLLSTVHAWRLWDHYLLIGEPLGTPSGLLAYGIGWGLQGAYT